MKSSYFKILVLAGIISLACTTKVSEWVLLNSIPNQYTLVYYHNAILSESQKQQNSEITRDIKDSNILFKNVQSKAVTKPYYALYYNERLFSKYNDPKELENLAHSPLREKIAGQLMAGKLCVMLYLKSGEEEKDNRNIQLLKKTIASSPFGETITIIELSRNDINEKHLISMLLNVEDDLMDIMEPMLFGIFGRFKALEPLLAKGITEENINLMIDFLTADCSCLIKDNLPGTDILFTNNWENPAPALVNAIIDANPSLTHL
ncbi:MAG: hypothetical protein MUC93_09450 [Bacteroidales bacterium]|jgi:hypothetical protein|nr:hypothetical protein [Bacteroidales bacterium]